LKDGRNECTISAHAVALSAPDGRSLAVIFASVDEEGAVAVEVAGLVMAGVTGAARCALCVSEYLFRYKR